MNPMSLNSYRALPKHMFTHDVPAATHNPQILALNNKLLSEYEIAETWFRGTEGLGILCVNAVNSDHPPIAMAYVGHQFGHRAPMLGDGRAGLAIPTTRSLAVITTGDTVYRERPEPAAYWHTQIGLPQAGCRA